MGTQINKICRASYFHLHNISCTRKYLSTASTTRLVHALVTSQGHPTNLFLTLSVPQRNLAGWQKYRCFDELAGKFLIDSGFAWELLTFSSILTRAGCRNSED